jgi:hypothetical protein
MNQTTSCALGAKALTQTINGNVVTTETEGARSEINDATMFAEAYRSDFRATLNTYEATTEQPERVEAVVGDEQLGTAVKVTRNISTGEMIINISGDDKLKVDADGNIIDIG